MSSDPGEPKLAVPLTMLGLLKVAVMVSVPSTAGSSIAVTENAKSPMPVLPLNVLSKVSVSVPSKVTPCVAAAAFTRAVMKLS